MGKAPIKFGLLAIIILEIGSLFFLLRVYDDFVSSPDSYYKNILVKQAEKEKQMVNEAYDLDN